MKMAMDLVPSPIALVQESQLEQGPNVSALAGERDEERDVGGVVLEALAVWVEVDRPRVPAYHERVGRHVLTDPHAFRERVPADLELVGPIHRLVPRRRGRRRWRRAGGGRRRRRREEGDGFRGLSAPLDCCAHPRTQSSKKILGFAEKGANFGMKIELRNNRRKGVWDLGMGKLGFRRIWELEVSQVGNCEIDETRVWGVFGLERDEKGM